MNVILAWAAAVATVCGAIDLRTGLIPNVITYSAFAALLAAALVSGSFIPALIGACAVGGLLAAMYGITRGNGLGAGDVKLGFCIGAGLGPWNGIMALGASFVLGALLAVVLLVSRRLSRHDALPLGPFLAAGTVGTILVAPLVGAP